MSCLYRVFVYWKVVFGKLFSKLSCVCLSLKKLINENIFQLTKNTLQSKKNLAWFPGKYFPFILDGKHFIEVVKNLKISYYLLICQIWSSNFWLLYILFDFFFLNSSLKIWFLYYVWFLFLWLLFIFLLLFSQLKFFIYQIWSLFF